MMVGEAMLMSMVGEAVSTIVGKVMSMSMVGEAVSMSMVDAKPMVVAGDEPTMLGDADELMETIDAGESIMIGKGAGESVDLDPIVPTVGAN
jgi:hypothetical protein